MKTANWMLGIDTAYDIAKGEKDIDIDTLKNEINENMKKLKDSDGISKEIYDVLFSINEKIFENALAGKFKLIIPEVSETKINKFRIKLLNLIYINGYVLKFDGNDSIIISWEDPESEARFDPHKLMNRLRRKRQLQDYKKIMPTASEINAITRDDGNIDIKKLINNIEEHLIYYHIENVIDGELENLLSNIKQDIIEKALDGGYFVTIPGINNSTINRLAVINILLYCGFTIKLNGDESILIDWQLPSNNLNNEEFTTLLKIIKEHLVKN